MKYWLVAILLYLGGESVFSQTMETGLAGIEFLTTRGNMTVTECDTEFCARTIFFVLPEHHTGVFYVRVFDPDCGGEYDNSSGLWETNTEFVIFGGTGCVYEPGSGDKAARAAEGEGILLDKKLFAYEPGIDGTWVTFGPFSVAQGEKLKSYQGRFFKLIVLGTTGNDSNQYAVCLSSSDMQNIEVSGASMYQDAFAFTEDLKAGKYSYSVSAEPLE